MQDPHALINAYIDCTIDDEGFEALCQWLREGEASRTAFARAMSDHAAIADWSGERRGGALMPELSTMGETEIERSQWIKLLSALDSKPGQAEVVELVDLSKPGSFLQNRSVAIWGGLAAAVLLVGVVLAVSLMGPGTTPSTNPIASGDPPSIDRVVQTVATLTAQHNAQWAERSITSGSALHAGQRLTLTAGFAEVTTHRGAVAILQAPCVVELSDNAIRLHTGKLVGLCHTELSKGFVVKTKHADITDLGTEFGVHAYANGVETTVFVGEVAVKTTNTPSQIITHNQTARVSVESGQAAVAVEDKPAEGFARRIPRAPIITDASINLPGFKVEVVPNGVYEDAKLFSDREHELNGIDAAGLPDFLIGGDLIRMPADARPDNTPTVGKTLQLEIELASPAAIYVLVPRNGNTGSWLTRDYVDTGLFVGCDNDGTIKHRFGTNTYESAIGPGESIDQSLAVWKYKHPVRGRAIVAGTISESMYAIIALPQQSVSNFESP
ncbi:MAG: hypothetical protein KTR15_02730 [Phycisphaeraceae bacterium]|nr:hypothetical protein [Phycisphaeraceae bacterium]